MAMRYIILEESKELLKNSKHFQFFPTFHNDHKYFLSVKILLNLKIERGAKSVSLIFNAFDIWLAAKF